MRKILPAIIAILFLGCTKRDIALYKQWLQPNGCTNISLNAGKINTDDYYVIKTFDGSGKLVHLKTQIRVASGRVILYDYDISYGANKATFKGKTKEMVWLLNDPDDISSDPALRFDTSYVIDDKDFEILFDVRTGYASEIRYVKSRQPQVKVTYDNHHFLNHLDAYYYDEKGTPVITDYTIETDSKGNIQSILHDVSYAGAGVVGRLGVRYQYNQNSTPKGSNQYYETPSVYIHEMFSLLEILNWGPFQPNLERTHSSVQWAIPPVEISWSASIDVDYSNHRYDSRGNLVGYDFDGDLTLNIYNSPANTGHRERVLSWSCASSSK